MKPSTKLECWCKGNYRCKAHARQSDPNVSKEEKKRIIELALDASINSEQDRESRSFVRCGSIMKRYLQHPAHRSLFWN